MDDRSIEQKISDDVSDAFGIPRVEYVHSDTGDGLAKSTVSEDAIPLYDQMARARAIRMTGHIFCYPINKSEPPEVK